MKAYSCLGALLLLLTTSASAADNKWVIHEWGTFTSLQNESGDAIGGINTDDEPVPDFVHRIGYRLVQQNGQIPALLSKGISPCHPDVTMRLETPVIYFHPPKSQPAAKEVNVQVRFRGGWLTEFFPDAEPVAPGLIKSRDPTSGLFNVAFNAALHPDIESKLEWDHLEIGGATGSVPNSTDHVWTSPRAVQTASVMAKNGEGEKFIFYRGIGHIDAPLKISRDPNTGELLFRSHLPDLPDAKSLAVHSMWLVDIHKDGKIAFRTLPPISLGQYSRRILAHTAPDFASGDFTSDNLAKLRDSLQSALVADGLFPDEAQGLLNTWEASYFKSPGLRVFFLVPREWTDYYLPLETSLPADINRVMVGRIELITPEQRNNLAKISAFTVGKIQNDAQRMAVDFRSRPNPPIEKWHELESGAKPLSSMISVPSTYETYLTLGRFRNALILDAVKNHPTTGLTNFVATYGIYSFRPVDTLAAKSN